VGLRYPHQLSGGQQQRVAIAMALACNPALLVLDEPTTGLDVTTQQQIVSLLADLKERLGMAMLYVTHDLSVLAQLADRVAVMYAGHLVEVAPAGVLFQRPRHPYTRGLIASVPQISETRPVGRRLRGLLRRSELPTGCPFAPRCDDAEVACISQRQKLEPVSSGHAVACMRWAVIHDRDLAAASRSRRAEGLPLETPSRCLEIKDVTIAYGGRPGLLDWILRRPTRPVVRNLDLTIEAGETLALVGESGSGKSTIARAISGLLPPQRGSILFEGRPLPGSATARSRELLRKIQYVFQNPDASLNPRMRVGGILTRPVQVFERRSRAELRPRVAAALGDVRLDEGYAARFPDQLSGGERQRVALARGLIAAPVLLICDEVLSALDVSVQANLLDLLQQIQRDRTIAMLFISHDLAVVRGIAHRVGVLFQGQLCEIGATVDVFSPPFHPYTHALLNAAPGLQKRVPPLSAPGPAAASDETRGCCYAQQCRFRIGTICGNVQPPWLQIGRSLQIRCHMSANELASRMPYGDVAK
jgi:peptide/nickel transport system ATP-binding protein